MYKISHTPFDHIKTINIVYNILTPLLPPQDGMLAKFTSLPLTPTELKLEFVELKASKRGQEWHLTLKGRWFLHVMKRYIR